MVRVAALAGALVLGGCALPPALSVASFAADAVSYAFTGKSVSDHGISLAMQEDCAVLNLLRSHPICSAGPHPEFGPVVHRDGQRANTLMASAVIRTPAAAAPAGRFQDEPAADDSLTVAFLDAGPELTASGFGDEPLWTGPIEVMASADLASGV